MVDERSIDFTIRGKDETPQLMRDLAERLKILTGNLQEQVRASQSGTAATGEFGKALRDVKQLTEDLIRQKTALSDFGIKSDNVDRVAEKLREVTALRDNFVKALPNAPDPTKEQVAQFDLLERRINQAIAARQRLVEKIPDGGLISRSQITDLEKIEARITAIRKLRQNMLVELPNAPNPTKNQLQQLYGLEAAVKSAQVAFIGSAETYNRSLSGLAKSGIEYTKVAAATEEVARAIGHVSDALTQGNRADLQFLTNKRLAVEATREQTKALQEQQLQERSAIALSDLRTRSAAAAARANSALDVGTRTPGQVAPTLADDIRQRLAASNNVVQPGSTISPADQQTLRGVQGEAVRVSAALNAAGKSAAEYKDELRKLNAVENELRRQSEIITRFQLQKAAAEDAVRQLERVATAVRTYDAALSRTNDPKQTEALVGQQSGLDRQLPALQANATRQLGLYEQERRALQSIGIAENEVGQAAVRLTQTADVASQARIDQLERERISVQNLAVQAGQRLAATQAQAAAGTGQAGTTASPGGTSGTRAALAAIPRQEAIIEVPDITAALDKSEAALTKRAGSAKTLENRLAAVYAIERKIASDTGLIENFEKQTVAVKAAEVEYSRAELELQRLIAAAHAGAISARELQEAEAKFGNAAANLNKQNQALTQTAKLLRENKIDSANLTAETDRLTKSAERLAGIQSKAEQKAATSNPFGLNAQKFHDLEIYAGNIYTQLALGQGLDRTFNSQAAQILELFDLSLIRLKLLALYGGPAIAGLFGVFLALRKAAEEVSAIRAFNAELLATASNGDVTATALFETTRAIVQVGVSMKDAKAAVTEFYRAGIAPERIAEFGKLARELSDTFGIKFSDAVKKLTEGFTGNFEGIKKLDEEYHVFTVAQLETIRHLYDTNKAAEGLGLAFDILKGKLRDGSENALSPAAKATRDLADAWDRLLTSFANTGVIERASELIATAARGLTQLTRFANGEISIVTLLNRSANIGPQNERFSEANAERAEVAEKLRLAEIKSKDNKISTADELRRQEEVPADSPYRSEAKIAALRAKMAEPEDAGEVGELRRKLVTLDLEIARLRVSSNVEKLTLDIEQLKHERESAKGRDDGIRSEGLPQEATRVSAGLPAGFGALRDEAADIAGVAREAFARVQRIEGKFVNGRFVDSETGARGPAQILPSTFGDLQRQYPALLKAGIDDIKTNLIAGALYLRQQIASSDGLLNPGYAKYHDGPNSRRPESDASIQARNRVVDGSSIADYTGNALSSGGRNREEIDQKIAAKQAELDRARLGGITPSSTAADAAVNRRTGEVTSNSTTNASGIVTGAPASPAVEGGRILNAEAQRFASANSELIRATREAADGLKDRTLRGAEALAREERIFNSTDGTRIRALRDEAGKRPGVNLQDPEVERALQYRLSEERSVAADIRIKRDKAESDRVDAIRVALEGELNAIQSKLAKADKTDIPAALRGVDLEFAKVYETLEKAANKGIPGIAALTAEIDRTKKEAQDKVVIDGSEAILKKTLEERALVYKKIASDLERGAISFATAAERGAAAAARFLPLVRTAQSNALEGLTRRGGANPSAAVREAIEKTKEAPLIDNKEEFKLFEKGYKELEDLQRARSITRTTQQELQKDGLQSRDGADAATAAVYEKTRQRSDELVVSLRQQLEALHSVNGVSEETYQRMSAALTKAAADSKFVTDFQKELSKTIDSSISGHAVAAFDKVGQALGTLAIGQTKIKDLFATLLQASGEFAAGVLKDVANMIIKYEVLLAVQSLLGKGGDTPTPSPGASPSGGSGGILGSLFGKIGGLFSGGGGAAGASEAGAAGASEAASAVTTIAEVAHSGGIIGSGGMSRNGIDMSVFREAVRYHAGGYAGLRSNEVATVLERGEEVLTKSDARHALNGGKNTREATSQRPLRQLLIFDPKDLSAGLSGSHGEEVVLTHIKNNPAVIKSFLGD